MCLAKLKKDQVARYLKEVICQITVRIVSVKLTNTANLKMYMYDGIKALVISVTLLSINPWLICCDCDKLVFWSVAFSFHSFFNFNYKLNILSQLLYSMSTVYCQTVCLSLLPYVLVKMKLPYVNANISKTIDTAVFDI